MLYVGVLQVNQKDRRAGIDANLDDLQAGVEACGRAAELLHDDAADFDASYKRTGKTGPFKSLVDRVDQLQAWICEQQTVLDELREGIVCSRQEMAGVDRSVADNHVVRRSLRVRSR
jgi:hypothetical protein